MMKTPHILSQHFKNLVDSGHVPVIMQILPALNSGGVEQGVIDISAAIVRAGGKSIVVSSGGIRVHEITKAGGTHITLPVNSKNPIIMWQNIGRLRKLIRSMDVDIVHPCSRAPAWSAEQAVEGTSARYVTSCHSAHKVKGMFKKFYNASMTKGELVIAVSHSLADYLEEHYPIDPKKIRVIHRGFAIEKFHPNAVTPDRLIKISQAWRIPDGAAVVMLPARITRSKGHMFLIDAIQQLERKIFSVYSSDPMSAMKISGRSWRPISTAKTWAVPCASSAIAAICPRPICWQPLSSRRHWYPKGSGAFRSRRRPWADP
jgi:glycosyltransferase involved in cell wall biosynthesis